jgi:hypothetical protein
MRLALKAQSQCRVTLETLAAIKNPPLVFAKQANIAHGAQQVNNVVALIARGRFGTPQNELLEAHGKRLDGRAANSAGASDKDLAALEALNRPKNVGGKGAIGTQRLSGREPGQVS